jgi:hypothetical protein
MMTMTLMTMIEEVNKEEVNKEVEAKVVRGDQLVETEEMRGMMRWSIRMVVRT